MPPPPLDRIPPEIAAVTDYEPFARARLDDNAWAYLGGGAADEITLRANREAFDRIRLNGRVLADFSRGGNTRVALFGQTFEHPIFLAPVAFQRLAHPEGERASALGAAAARAGMGVSTHASVAFEEIAKAGPPALWLQLYVQPDLGLTREVVLRAEAAGFRAVIVTGDAAVNGVRNRQQRAGFRLPPGVESVNTGGWTPRAAAGFAPDALCGGRLATEPTWKILDWLRSFTRLPLVVKGVVAPEDAELAVRHGADGIVVSNHGGRTLDTLPATIEALPRVAEAVAGRIPILLDGGVRRGTDVLKALALGARAVLVGQPYVLALAAAGAPGVAHVVNLLRSELEIAMALTGKSTLAEVDRSVIWKP